MKHLKTFENINEQKFKVGDYVVATDISYIDRLIHNVFGKDYYIKVKNFLTNQIGKLKYIYGDQYHVEYYVPKNLSLYDDDIVLFNLGKEQKLRLATPEEIEDYKMKENERKYNL